MKPHDPYDSHIAKSKLPVVSKKHFQLSQSRNHSLKKLFLNNNQNQSSSVGNVGLFPKLNKKSKISQNQNKKIVQTSLQKNHTKWYLPNNNLKKRQKLHTQGQTSQSLTQIQQSFTSLTNKILDNEEDVKDTMMDFRKKIQQNKLIIKKEIEKKNKQNQSTSKRDKSFIKKKRVNSSKILEHSPSFHQQKDTKKTIQTPSNKNKQLSIKERSSSKKNKYKQSRKRQKTQMQYIEPEHQKILPKRQSQGLFTDLQVILDQKMKPQHQKSKHQQKKLKNLLQKLHKFKKQKQYSSSYHEHEHASFSGSEQLLILQSSTDTFLQNNFSKLKRENNYKDWNKLDLSSTSQITYRKSSFEQQLRKVQEYTDRNDASLQKYLGMRKQLQKIGFQMAQTLSKNSK